MADDNSTFTQACDAADLLLRLTQELAAKPLAMAVRVTGKKADGFEQIVGLEIAGSMAVDRVLSRYLKLAMPEAEKLPKDHQMHHLMQAIVNPLVGGALAFTDDMPAEMQKDFVGLLTLSLGEALRARQFTRGQKEASLGRKH